MAGFECNREDSFKFLGDLANRLTERVKDSIRSTGFGIFVDYLHYVKLDNHFSKWVISNLDLNSGALKIESNCVRKISRSDVHSILGIPCKGARVVGVVAGDAAGGTRSAYDSIMDILRRRPEDASPVVAAKRIIMTHVACGNKQDEGVFKVAYVVYVLNFMLGNTVINYWPALFDHEKIDKYDWATCVVHEIMKGPLKSGGELSAGCKMFLQVCSTVLIYIHFSGLYRLLFIPSYTHNVLQK
jgi:hypothetical protein